MTKKLIPFLALLFALPCSGAIAHDADSNQGTTIGNVSSFSWSHTMSSSANGALVCGVFANAANTGFSISTVTYNSVGLTPIQSVTGASVYKSWIGILFGPSTGANTVLVTLSTTTGGTGEIWGACSSFTGVNQSGVDSSGCTATGTTGTTISCNVTTVNANAWIVDVVADRYNNGSPTANSPQVRSYSSPAFTGSINGGTSYNGPIATPASTSDGWAAAGGGANSGWALCAFSIAPSGGAGGVKRLRGAVVQR